MPASKAHVTLHVNGKQYQLDGGTSASFTLNDFLRDISGLTGTKVMCREGGCGCCVVAASKPDGTEKFAVNSCMLPVLACDGWQVTTTEGLGNKRDGYHVIQERLTEYNGSQCGFCSPGMVMSMYGLVASKKDLSKEQIEASFDGNLCRCTGYRAILDAFKSLSTDTTGCQDIEDLVHCNGTNGMCEKSVSGKCEKKCGKTEAVQLTLADGTKFYKPTSLTEMKVVLQATKEEAVRIVVGNTSVGIYKNDGPYTAIIDIKAIPELSETSDVVNGTFSFGANVSLTKLIDILKRISVEPGFEYCGSIAQHWCFVANVPVRNIASWAGNLMTKYYHQEFPSDVFLLLAAVDAEIKLLSLQGEETTIAVEKLLEFDMKGKMITQLILRPKPGSTLETFKITPRSQNAHAYVNAAHLFILDENKIVKERPRLFFGGVTCEGVNYIRATQTEEFLTNKNLSDDVSLVGALAVLSSEIDTTDDFRKPLSVSLLYKTFLSLLGEKLPEILRSGGTRMKRPLMHSEQGLVTNEEVWPLTKPMTRVTAKMQAAGEAEYVNDIPAPPSTLFAAFVIARQGNATLDQVDTSEALKQDGVLRFISAEDVPGINTISPPANTPSFMPEPIFCDGKVHFAGQPIGLIVAKSQQIANQAVKLVRVTYKDVGKPVTDIREAIEKEMFFGTKVAEMKKGDTDAAIAQSAHIIEGEITNKTQQHFAMETQACLCVPTEDHLYMYPTSQYIDCIQQGVSHALGINLNKIAVEVRRLGGGFGSKIDRNNCVSVPCAIAAHVMRAPVKLSLDLNTNLAMIGKRLPHLIKYRVGFDNEGKLEGIEIKYFHDSGFTNNVTFSIPSTVDNVYSCDNWHVTSRGVRTHTPANTYCRTPGTMKAVYYIESIIEHVATVLGKDPHDVRMRNMYKEGQVTPKGEKLSFFKMDEMVKNLLNSADVVERKAQIVKFNEQNRWRKRGLSMVPTRWPVSLFWANYGALVSIYAHDGSVAIAHGGIEMGQGINTKTMQVCAHALGAPLSLISVRPSQDLATANSMASGGSITSELCCLAVIRACEMLLERMKPVKDECPDLSWPELVKMCHKKLINLTAQFMVEKSQYPHTMVPDSTARVAYSVYGLTCAEVELDVLTGERQVSRVDILFDVGESVNPMIDVGQIEGAFAMALGFFLMEDTNYDETTGENLSNGTWNYKVPTTKDMPADFRVKLLNWAPNPLGVVRSKSVGEPPMLMGCAVVFALKQAIQEARREVGEEGHFALNTPVTVEKTFQLCLPTLKSYTI